MTDFAGRIITRLTTATASDRTEFARRCVSEFDRNTDGAVSATEFQRVFAALRRTDELTGGSTTSFVSSGCRPTLFECTLYPSWSNAYAASAYQAMAMIDRFDQDADSIVTLDELSSDPEAETTPEIDPADPLPPTEPEEPPQTPTQRADALLAAYDITGKGYITIDDVVSKWLADPSLGDIADAGNAIEAWDTDGDGQVSRADIMAAYEIMDAADTVLSAFGGTETGTIALTNLDTEALQALDLDATTMAAWDADKNGMLSRNEIIDGLKLMRLETASEAEKQAFRTIFARLDSNGDDRVSSDEMAQAMTELMLDQTRLTETFSAWDSNGDQGISLDELQAGYTAVNEAKAIVAAYDAAGKGYFDEADLQRVIDENGSAEGQGSAADILAAWDRDGDGKVSVQDVVTMRALMVAAASSTPTDLPSV